MTPYENIISFLGINTSSLESLFIKRVLNTVSEGSVTTNGIIIEKQTDSQKINDALLSKSTTPQLYSAFIDVSLTQLVNNLNSQGKTPLALPMLPIFDVSSIPALGIPIYPLPTPGGELAWLLGLATILGIPTGPPELVLSLLLTRLTSVGLKTPTELATIENITQNTQLSNRAEFTFLNSQDYIRNNNKFYLQNVIDELINVISTAWNTHYIPSIALMQPITLSLLPLKIRQFSETLIYNQPSISLLLSQQTKPTLLLAVLDSLIFILSNVLSLIIIGSTIGTGQILHTYAVVYGLL
jgi:hypothetical protein